MSLPIDITKTYVTKDGREVTILTISADAVEAGDRRPVVALVKNDDGTDAIRTYTIFGERYPTSDPRNAAHDGNLVLADEFYKTGQRDAMSSA